MTNRLAARYARYGLLANFVLAAIEQMRMQEEAGQPPTLSGDDKRRLVYLQDLLADSWQGSEISGRIKRTKPPSKSKQLSESGHPAPPWHRSTRSKLDDATIVRRVLPPDCQLETFIPKAGTALEQLIDAHLPEDREFLDGPMTLFLTRLARGNRGVRPAARRTSRQRVPLG